jgi:hypothetical protein
VAVVWIKFTTMSQTARMPGSMGCIKSTSHMKSVQLKPPLCVEVVLCCVVLVLLGWVCVFC